MSESDTPGALAAALAEVQKKLPEIRKDKRADVRSDKGSYSYTYADLAAVSAAVMPLLSENGLAFIAKPTLWGEDFVLAYSLLHVSGQREDGFYPLPKTGTPQSIGSAITYGRRYCLCSVTGVAPEDDDDGAAAQAHAQQEREDRRRKRETKPPPDEWSTTEEPKPPPAQSTNKFAGLMADFTHLGVTEKADYRAITSAILNRPVASITELDERALKTLRKDVHALTQLPEDVAQSNLAELRQLAAQYTAEDNRVDRPAERQGTRLSKEQVFTVSELVTRIYNADPSEIPALFAEAEREGVLEETTLDQSQQATTVRGLLVKRQMEASAEGEK